MSLLSALCLALDVDDIKSPSDASDGSDDDDDPLGDKLNELGLGGEALKGLMKNIQC